MPMAPMSSAMPPSKPPSPADRPLERPVYWFPAKRHGWGWGLPVAWQGWLVLIAFFVLLLAGAVVLIPSRGELAFVGYSLVLALLLVGVCFLKGEPPGWRSGK